MWASRVVIAVFAVLLLDTLVVPSKWRQVKIGEDRDSLLQRLGDPRIAGWDVKGDEWTKYTGVGCVAMRVAYYVTDNRVMVRGVRWSRWIGCRNFHFRLRKDESL